MTHPLIKAAELIEAGGLAKNVFRRGDACCVMGAISSVMFQLPPDAGSAQVENRVAVARVLERRFPERVAPVPDYYGRDGVEEEYDYAWRVCQSVNDHPDTTAEDIVSALREAASA